MVVAVNVVAVITLEGVAGTATGCTEDATPVVFAVGRAVFVSIFDGVEGTTKFFCFFTEEGCLEGCLVVTGEVGTVSSTNHGVAHDVALEGDEVVAGGSRLGLVEQPFVVNVTLQAFGAEVGGRFHEVTQAEASVLPAKAFGRLRLPALWKSLSMPYIKA